MPQSLCKQSNNLEAEQLLVNDEHVVDDNEVKAVVVYVLLNTAVIVERRCRGPWSWQSPRLMENTDQLCLPRITNSFLTIQVSLDMNTRKGCFRKFIHEISTEKKKGGSKVANQLGSQIMSLYAVLIYLSDLRWNCHEVNKLSKSRQVFLVGEPELNI